MARSAARCGELAERHKVEAEQHAERVAPTDHEIFPEQIIAEKKEELPHRPEGREAPDQDPDAERDHKLQHLHRDRIGGEARDHPQQQMPEPGMALVELGEEIERRVAGRSHHEGLQLVTPHDVPEQPDRVVDGKEDKQQIWKHQADRGDEARAPIGARDARDRHQPSPQRLTHPQSAAPRKAQAIGLRLIAPPHPLCYRLRGSSGGLVGGSFPGC